jgi:signal transduction histidine kinase
MTTPLRSLTTARIGGLPVVDVAVASALSAYAVFDVAAAQGRGTAAAIAAVAMTLPVAWCRRAPVAAAAALGAGGLLNALLFPSIVRCGVALPAVFIVTFSLGVCCERVRSVVGLLLCAVNVASQASSDPRLGEPELLVLLPILVAFFALGRLVRAWTAAVEALRARTAELESRREETARLTMLADRRRVSEKVDAELRELIGRIGATAAASRDVLATEPGSALAVLASIELDGRDALNRMRAIVGRSETVGPSPPSTPAETDASWSRWPLAAALIVTTALLVAGALAPSPISGPATLLLALPLLVAFALGTRTRTVPGLVGVALMSAGLQAASGGGFNPLFEMVTIGPWLAGLAVRSRRRLATTIEIRNRELESTRVLNALAAVRYERSRIAHELHDIVAHCVTVSVVQAAAARRLASIDPDRAAHALDAIAEATQGAEIEIALLTGHLDRVGPPGVPLIEELVRRTAAAGLRVRYHPVGELGGLPPQASDTAYRVVQESVTNAMKHAPGAPIDIAVREAEDRSFEVEVVTAAANSGASWLEAAGGGHGLEGMCRRVASCGGTLTAGPTGDGGWRVSARFPAPIENGRTGHRRMTAAAS